MKKELSQNGTLHANSYAPMLTYISSTLRFGARISRTLHHSAKVLSVLVMLLVIFLPATAGAASVNQFCTNNNGVNGSGTSVCQSGNSNGKGGNPFLTIARIVLNTLSVVLGVAALFIIVYQGFRLITSNGDSQTVSRAREGIITALVGIVIAMLAQAIVVFVINKVYTPK